MEVMAWHGSHSVCIRPKLYYIFNELATQPRLALVVCFQVYSVHFFFFSSCMPNVRQERRMCVRFTNWKIFMHVSSSCPGSIKNI